MKVLYKYENGKKFMGIINNEVKAIEALFEVYANKSFYNEANYWNKKEEAIKAWWQDVQGRCFIIENTKIWG